MSEVVQTTTDIDLTGQIDGLTGVAKVVTTTYTPVEPSKTLFVLIHGGTYTRRYWDLIVPGYTRDAYSCALYLAQRGHTVVTLDMLGTGESTVEIGGQELKPKMMAQAIAVIMAQLKTQSAQRETAEAPVFSVLVGHSMGAYVTLLAQSLYAPADALVLLGNTVGPAENTGLDVEMLLRMVDVQGFITLPRPFMHQFFHGSFPPPAEVIAADDAFSVPIPIHLVGETMTVGNQIALAARVTVPLLVGCAQEDLCANPLEETSYFPQSASRTVFVLPDSGHCANFSSTRVQLWGVMDRFAHLAYSLRTPSR